jgi:hypothetical protein
MKRIAEFCPICRSTRDVQPLSDLDRIKVLYGDRWNPLIMYGGGSLGRTCEKCHQDWLLPSDDLFRGRWRIFDAEDLSTVVINFLGEAELVIDTQGPCSIRFRNLAGPLEYEVSRSADNEVLMEFTCLDSGSPVNSGRGWCVRDGRYLKGRICLFGCDATEFTAVRASKRAKANDASDKSQ